MIYGSVCSGIEAATVAWHPLGWTPAFFSEIDAYPRALLSHHYPEVPLHGDFTTIQAGDYRPIDLLVGGTPCQSFSVAGLRGGLDDDRGNLALEFLRLADRLRPNWVVWENVPGVLSSNGGRDFGAFLGGLGELGYGWSYRVLDAQYFDLAQRRARVFVVGCLGDWRGPAAVLFEPESLSGDPAPSRETGQGSTTNPGWRPAGDSGILTAGGNDLSPLTLAERGRGGECSLEWRQDGTSNAILTPTGGRSGLGVGAVAVCGSEPIPLLDGAKGRTDARGSRDGAALGNPGDPMFTLRAGAQHGVAVAFQPRHFADRPRMGGEPSDVVHTLSASSGQGDSSPCVAFQQNSRDEVRLIDGDGQIVGALAADSGMKQTNYLASRAHVEVMPTIRAGGNQTGGDRPPGTDVDTAETLLTVATSGGADPAMQVRRLTPTECERLQGFPDGYTLVPYRGKPAADGPRYKGIGNSMAVPVMAWIGRRIDIVDKIMRGS